MWGQKLVPGCDSQDLSKSQPYTSMTVHYFGELKLLLQTFLEWAPPPSIGSELLNDMTLLPMRIYKCKVSLLLPVAHVLVFCGFIITQEFSKDSTVPGSKKPEPYPNLQSFKLDMWPGSILLDNSNQRKIVVSQGKAKRSIWI